MQKLDLLGDAERVLLYLAFPDADNAPSLTLKDGRVLRISLYVPSDLSEPIRRVCAKA